MAGAGYRTFASGEVLTANNVQTYLMDQAVQVYAGTAARSSAVPTPSTGMVAYSTATGLQVFNGSAWANVGGATYAVGTASSGAGSAITDGGTAYTLYTFTSDGSFVVSTAGIVEVLIVGGGSGGGREPAGAGRAAGGGGGGGVLNETIYLTATTYAVQVGAGGAGSTVDNGNGSFGTMSFVGDFAAGFGGDGDASGFNTPMATAGGPRGQFTTSSNPVKMGGQGAIAGSSTSGNGGGGGGQSAGSSKNGGAGLTTTFNGTSLVFGSGGGGGSTGTGGTGGTNAGNGGSNGAGTSASPANRGAGGGGGCNGGNGGSGSSGIVLIRVKS